MDRFQPYYDTRHEEAPELINPCVICGESEAYDAGVCESCEAEAVERAEPTCPVRAKIAAQWRLPIGEFMALLRAHEGVQCEYCRCGRFDVVSDRQVLGTPDSVCCGEAA